MLAVSLLHIHGAFLLGGKNLFQKTVYQFWRTVESVQIGLDIIPQVTVTGLPFGAILFSSRQLLFQLAVLHIHHIAVCGLLFQSG